MKLLSPFLFALGVLFNWSVAQLTSQQILLNATESAETKSQVSLNPLYTMAEVDSNYVVGPGDFFEIIAGDKTITVQVSIEGAISLERVGIIPVNKLPLHAAKRAIISRLETRYNPEQIFVQLVQTKMLAVTISGAVASPGLYHLPSQARLSSLIRAAVGILASGDEHNIQLIRGTDTLTCNYYAAEYQGDMENNPLLQQGDVIFIPFIDYSQNLVQISFSGSVWNIPWHENMTIFEALKQSGVIRISQNVNAVRMYSTEEKNRDSSPWWDYTQSLSKIVPNNSTIELVAELQYVYVGGAVAGPGKQLYIPGNTILDYMSSAGYTPISGDFTKVYVIRSGEKIKINPYKDPVLPQDFIQVPKESFESTKDLVSFISQIVGILVSAVTFYVLLTKE